MPVQKVNDSSDLDAKVPSHLQRTSITSLTTTSEPSHRCVKVWSHSLLVSAPTNACLHNRHQTSSELYTLNCNKIFSITYIMLLLFSLKNYILFFKARQHFYFNCLKFLMLFHDWWQWFIIICSYITSFLNDSLTQ